MVNLHNRHALSTYSACVYFGARAGGKIEKNEVGGACGAHGGMGEVCTGF